MHRNVLRVILFIAIVFSQMLVAGYLFGQNVDSLYREELKKTAELKININSLEDILTHKKDSIKINQDELTKLEQEKIKLEEQHRLLRDKISSMNYVKKDIDSLKSESSNLAKSIDSLNIKLQIKSDELRQRKELKNILKKRMDERKSDAHKRVAEVLNRSLFDISRNDLNSCNNELNRFPNEPLRQRWIQADVLVTCRDEADSLLNKPYSGAIDSLFYQIQENARESNYYRKEAMIITKALSSYKSSYSALENLDSYLNTNRKENLIVNQDDLSYYLNKFKNSPDNKKDWDLIEKSLQKDSLHAYIKKRYEEITTVKKRR